MKIVFPIGSFYPSQEGGPSNSVYLLAKELSTLESYEVSVITTNKGISENALDFDQWIKLGDKFKVTYLKRNWYYPLAWIRIAWSEITHSEVVHLTSVFYPPSVIAALISVIKRKKVVWSVRGEFNREALSFSSWKKLPLRPILKLLGASNRIVFHSTSLKEQKEIASSFMRKKSILIPNGVESSDAQVKRAMPKTILYLGRLHPIKAIDNAIRAFTRSSLPSKGFNLIIAGKGSQSYYDYLLKLVGELDTFDRIEFIGHTVGETKDKIIANSGWLILPSFSENFGNVVVESLRQCTPVVASSQTPWEDLALYQAGYHVPNSIQELSQVFDTIGGLNDSDYHDFSQNALKLMSEKYTMNVIIDKWKTIYEKD